MMEMPRSVMWRKYRIPVYYACVFLLVFSSTVFLRWWKSIELKSDLLNEAIISLIALQSLHTGLYHVNIIFWRAAKIDYSGMFDFSAEDDLYRYPFLALVEYLACVVFCLSARFVEITEDQQQHFYILLSSLVLITLRTIYAYRSDIKTIISFPSREVSKIDVFLGDQMCSQVPGLRKILYIFCYYVTGNFKKQDYRFYETSTVYLVLSYALSSFPFLWRGIQCFWKFREDSQTSHLINLGKYCFAMLEALARVAYENDKTTVWFFLLFAISIVATVYQLCWDFLKDWGLLQFNSDENRWLRRELRLSWKSIYYFSMGLNLIFRFSWILTLIDGDITFWVAVAEVFRRVQWNFYRLENQQIIDDSGSMA